MYNKLVRNKIVNIIKSKGEVPIYKKLNNEEYFYHLNLKLQEELQEYLKDNSIEELADLVEVIYAVLDYKNVAFEDFERIRKEKIKQRGNFTERIFLENVKNK